MTGRVSRKDAQCAAWRSALAHRRPSQRTVGVVAGSETRRGQRGIKLEQAGEALGDGRVMAGGVVLCQVRGQDAQQVIGTEGGARMEKQPSSLQVVELKIFFHTPPSPPVSAAR